MSEEVFYNNFQPIKNHIESESSFDGCMFETYGEELEYVQSINKTNPNLVWTVIDSDGELVICAGYAYVNRMGYLITKTPWVDINTCVEDN